MAFRFDPERTMQQNLRRVALDRLDQAIEALDRLAARGLDPDADPQEAARLVHDVRKRTKEVRGLLRLVGPALGPVADAARAELGAAADQLASSRDATVVAAAYRSLVEGDPALAAAVPDAAAAAVPDAAAAAVPDAAAVAAARARLAAMRDDVGEWRLPDRFASVGAGLGRTYRQGRRRMRAAAEDRTPEAFHRWRIAAKALWYQVRLFEPVAPGVLGATVASLDRLGEALGDDHDLAVLLERGLDGPLDPTVRDAAVRRREALEADALALGARLYAESPDAFVARVRAYWRCERRVGPEPPPEEPADATPASGSAPTPAGTVERERKFLVARRPPLPSAGHRVRQGYLASGPVSVRVRKVDGVDGVDGTTHVLTVKSGDGAVRTEVEWPMTAEQFDALWPATSGQRIDKVRYLLPLDELTAELDVFADALEGLELVEVEFATDEAMAAFEPPAWFGDDVTDDPRFTNAALALDGDPRRR